MEIAVNLIGFKISRLFVCNFENANLLHAKHIFYMENKQEKRKFLKKLKNKYRLLIINETNLQEKTSLSLSPGNVILIISAGLLMFSLVSWGIYTLFPTVKDYAPGYAQSFDGKMKNEVLNKMKNLENKLSIAEKREKALQQIINGEDVTAYDLPYKADKSRSVELEINETKAEGDRVRNANAIIENAKQKEEKSKPMVNTGIADIGPEQDILGSEFLFFTPINGVVASTFNPGKMPHIEIMTEGEESVKAAMDGTVIFNGWTPEFGYTITIQHPNNWVTSYKQMSAIYKEVGEFVKAGEAIAITGEITGKSSRGKLAFELWHNGLAVNPLNYISF